jgi:uncharacterized membrane protein
MKRKRLALDVVSLGSLAGLLAFTASAYDALPARIANHFDLSGRPNGWMDRPYATWGVDAFALGLWALIRFSPRWLPRANGWRQRADQSPMVAVAMLTMLLLVALGAFTVWNGLHPETPRGAALSVVIGAYALAFSSVLPRTRRNPLLGVRTSWSLTSDENWHRTNRIASYTLALGGLACIACGLAGAAAVGICVFIAAAIVPWVYSWVLAYRLPPEA